MRDAIRAVPRRELMILGAAIALGLIIRFAFLIVTRHHPLAGDQIFYDSDAKLWAAGHHFWSTAPTGVPHESMWKAPGYPAFSGVLYDILGLKYHRTQAVQIMLAGPATITIVWALARRLFTPTVGLVAAFVAAIYPFIWQFEPLLYSESIAVPLSALLCLLVIDRKPTAKLAVLAGLLIGVNMLIRPTALMFGVMVVVTWWMTAGFKEGTKWAVVSAVAAMLVVAPWTIRNHHVSGGFVPISVQDLAAYGVFNDEAANDKDAPWAWRPFPPGAREVVAVNPPPSDLEIRRTFQKRTKDFISDHPTSVIKAIYWNGVTRTFDLRRPGNALNDVGFEGRSRIATKIGLGMYYVIAPLAILTLLLIRRRRGIVWPFLALVASACVMFAVGGSTRYRAPIEPFIVVLACAAPFLWLSRRDPQGSQQGSSAPS